MNRTVLFGGVAAVVVLLGAAGYLIFSGRQSAAPTDSAALENAGPATLNPVSVITDNTANQSEDGQRLNIGFSSFELAAKSGQTASAVFSTTWHLKISPEDRVVVASATLSGFMKSTGTPPAVEPAPAATPTPAATPAETPAATPATTETPAAPGTSAATPAEAAKPAPQAPVGPVSGDGVVRVVLTVAGETTVSEWRDATGAGSDRKLSKAVSFAAATSDLKAGGSVPVTVSVEVSGGTSTETLAKLNAIDMQLFVEKAPVPVVAPAPATPADGATTTAPVEGATPATPPPAENGTTLTPPATTTP